MSYALQTYSYCAQIKSPVIPGSSQIPISGGNPFFSVQFWYGMTYQFLQARHCCSSLQCF